MPLRRTEGLYLGEEVETKVVVRVAEDRLLDEHHVAARLLNLLAEAENVLALLPQDAVHGRVVRYHHVVLHVRLGRREAELNEADLGVLDARGSPCGLLGTFVEDQTVHQLRVVDRAAHLLYDANVVQVHIGRRRWVNDRHHCVHSDGGEDLRILVHHLASQQREEALRAAETHHRIPATLHRYQWHTLDDRQVSTAWISCSRSARSSGVDTSCRISSALTRAAINDSEI